MKNLIAKIVIACLLTLFSAQLTRAQKPEADSVKTDSVAMVADSTSLAELAAASTDSIDLAELSPAATGGFHHALKRKFIEGNAGFMSLATRRVPKPSAATRADRWRRCVIRAYFMPTRAWRTLSAR